GRVWQVRSQSRIEMLFAGVCSNATGHKNTCEKLRNIRLLRELQGQPIIFKPRDPTTAGQ
ncbi:MAG TPA: hypothetical protein DD437_12195, partial [Rhodobiaceae bacterium]|nr:hypothetical protein [Rhodobiaceae bacterium]